MTSGRAILVVDDDVLALRATSRALKTRGFEVVAVPTKRAALRAPGPFGCAVVDLILDADSGLDLGRELLASGRARSVIFFSGVLDPEVRRQAEELGPFVAKASEFRVLIEQVESCFGPDSNRSGVVEVNPSELEQGNGDSDPPPLRAIARR